MKKVRLRIYDVALEMVAEVALIARRLELRDRDLARQMKRASTSVPLNVAEGTHSRRGNQRLRFETAMGSARETMATIEVAIATKYIAADGTGPVLRRLDQIVATLWTLIHR